MWGRIKKRTVEGEDPQHQGDVERRQESQNEPICMLRQSNSRLPMEAIDDFQKDFVCQHHGGEDEGRECPGLDAAAVAEDV